MLCSSLNDPSRLLVIDLNFDLSCGKSSVLSNSGVFQVGLKMYILEDRRKKTDQLYLSTDSQPAFK